MTAPGRATERLSAPVAADAEVSRAAPGVERQRQGGYGLLAFLTAVYAVSYMDRQLMALLAPAIKADLRLNDTQVGLLSGLSFALFYGAFGVLLSGLPNKVDRVRMIGVCVAIFSAMTAACGAAQSFITLLLARMGVGIGEAGPMPAAMSLIGEQFEGARRTFANTLFTIAGAAGSFLVYVVMGAVADRFGWRLAFVGAGLCGTILALIAFLVVRDPRSGEVERQIAARQANQQFRRLARNAPFWLAALGAMFAGMCGAAASQWVPSVLSRSFQMTSSEIGLFLGIGYGLIFLTGVLTGGYVAARLRRLSVQAPMYLVAAAVAGMCLGYFVLFRSVGSGPAILGLFLAILFTGPIQGPLFAFIQDVVPPELHSRASAVTFFMTSALGLGLGTLLIGIISDRLALAHGDESLRRALVPVVGFTGLFSVVACLAAAILSRAPRGSNESAP